MDSTALKFSSPPLFFPLFPFLGPAVKPWNACNLRDPNRPITESKSRWCSPLLWLRGHLAVAKAQNGAGGACGGPIFPGGFAPRPPCLTYHFPRKSCWANRRRGRSHCQERVVANSCVTNNGGDDRAATQPTQASCTSRSQAISHASSRAASPTSRPARRQANSQANNQTSIQENS